MHWHRRCSKRPVLRSLKKPALVVALAAVIFWLWPAGELRYPPGTLVTSEPVQAAITPLSLPEVDGFQLTALATYELTARVLHKKRYWGGRDGRLVPFDVAVGWGRMSDQTVLDQFKISQSNRFFFYQWQHAPPLPLNDIICHAANMHVISANADVATVVSKLRRGEVVNMGGYLVNVSGPNGFVWPTSLTRSDSGRGACEVFYVERAERQEIGL